MHFLRGLSSTSGSQRHAAIAHSTWFRVPEQGMDKHELLAQGSAFVSSATETRSSYALVCAHVAAPHRWWKRYYPSAEYLAYVKDSHCESRLRYRDEEHYLLSAPLSAGFAHSTLDVAAFPTAIDTPRSHSLQLRNTELFSLVDGEDLAIHGHILREDESLERTLIYGRFIGRDGARGFVRTDDTCEMGMCGGPVLDSNDNVVGILEGVVPNLQENESAKSDMHKNIAGSGAFIGAQEINLFLNDVHKSLLGTAPKTEEKA